MNFILLVLVIYTTDRVIFILITFSNDKIYILYLVHTGNDKKKVKWKKLKMSRFYTIVYTILVANLLKNVFHLISFYLKNTAFSYHI